MKSISKQNVALGIVAVAVMAGIGWFSLRGTAGRTGEIAGLAADVLSPDMFGDEKTRAAYQTAKDIPEVLDQLCDRQSPVFRG